MICKQAITKSFFFTLLLVLFSINISYGYTLSGFITDNSGSNEWHVIARETSNANLGNEDNNVSNDPNGPNYRTYEMALFPGNYNVHCESYINVNECVVTLSSPIYNVDFSQDYLLNPEIPPFNYNYFHITGFIKNVGGVGIPSVVVSATSNDGACTSSSASDGTGSFDLTVIPGTYTLLFSAPTGTTYLNRGITGVVVAGNTALNDDTILTSLAKPLLSGYFYEQIGTPTLGIIYDSALIHAYNPSLADSNWTSTTDGNFFFNLFIGRYSISALLYEDYNNGNSQTSTTYQEIDYLQAANNNALGLPLPSSYAYYLLNGTVTDNQGIAIPGVRIDALGHDGKCSAWSYTDSQVNNLGHYSLKLIPGRYMVTVTAPSAPATYPPYRINNITISGNCQRDIRLFSDDTILKEAIDELSGNLDIALDVFDIITQGNGNALSYDIEVTDVRDLLEIVLNWNWADLQSRMSLEFRDPAGHLYGPYQYTQPPVMVPFSNPAQGTWTCKVTATNVPYNNYPFALVAGVTRIYALNTSVSGGHGTILPASGIYNQGFVVSLTATPDPGYQVKAWHGTDNDSSKSTTNSVTMSANRTVTVEFELIPAPPAPTTYTLNASVSSGNGTIHPGSGTYSQGTVVSLSATPESGYQVKAWYGTNNDSSKSTTNSITMSANRTVTVEFELIPAPPASTTYTLNVSVVNGHGSITAFPSSGPYSQGTNVSLSATPESGYKVKAWTGTDNDASTGNSNTVTMNADHVVSVEFVPVESPEEKNGGGGGGGCFISTCASTHFLLSVIPLIILLGIVFIGLSFPNRIPRNSFYNDLY